MSILEIIIIVIAIIAIICGIAWNVFDAPFIDFDGEMRSSFDKWKKQKKTEHMQKLVNEVKQIEIRKQLLQCTHQLVWDDITQGYMCPICMQIEGSNYDSYALYNSTHCELCGEEYDVNENGECFCYHEESGYNSVDEFERIEHIYHYCEECKFKIDEVMLEIQYQAAKNKMLAFDLDRFKQKDFLKKSLQENKIKACCECNYLKDIDDLSIIYGKYYCQSCLAKIGKRVLDKKESEK